MSTPSKLNFKAKALLFAFLLSVFNQASAVHAASLYNVETLVADESAEVRWRTFKEGLNEVFIRISGDSIVMDKIKHPSASTYIKQYSYDPVDKPVTDAKGVVLNYRLKIQYNGSAMEKYLLDNGFPVWSEHRNDVVVWLAIRDGRNEYVLKDADNSLIKIVADEALHRRGLSDRWPIYDYKDRQILGVTDIRGGFKDPVVKASARYGKGPALTGSMIWNGSKWQSSWSLLMAGDDVGSDKHWSVEDADYNTLINKAVDQAADAMGIAFALHDFDKNQQLVAVNINIQTINTIEKFRKAEEYLTGLRAVETVVPAGIDGENVTFAITLSGTEADFLDLINNDTVLVKTEAIVPESELPNTIPVDAEIKIIETAGTNNSEALSEPVVDKLVVDKPIVDDPVVEKKEQVAVYHYKLIK